MINIDWIGISAVIITAIIALAGYLRKPIMVSYSYAENLKRTITEQKERIGYLEARVETLMSEAHFWQEHYRQRVELDGH